MNLQELIPKLKEYNTILVTGSQRSGTTIATKMISEELSYFCLLEESFDTNDIFKFFFIMQEITARKVIQCPTMSSVMHFLKREDIAIVYMIRDEEEVLNSVKRINWEFAEFECNKYFKPIQNVYNLKKKIWDEYQKDNVNSFELDYESLKSHKLWVDKEKRINFTPRQTEI